MAASQWISKLYAKTVLTMPNALGLVHFQPNTVAMFILWITKRSGTEEEYRELSQLLQDITTYRRDMEKE